MEALFEKPMGDSLLLRGQSVAVRFIGIVVVAQFQGLVEVIKWRTGRAGGGDVGL